jgi:threonine aldolase
VNERGFASDNSATVHPLVLGAIARVNVGHAFGYGHDPYTERVLKLIEEQFRGDARAFLVFNGTAANVLSLRAVCRPWQAAICAETAHLNVDEGGAPEAMAGVKLLTIRGENGKLTPSQVKERIARIGDEHAVQPRVLSISQCTELGTCYSMKETKALADVAHAHDMFLHVDGARLANASAWLELPLHALTTDAGVDVVSFGGTKNGLLGGEAVVFLRPELADGFQFLRKQSLQLASKMRFLAAQFEALLTDELWLLSAHQANQMALRLGRGVNKMRHVEITRPVQSNAVFARISAKAIARLQQDFAFYTWDEATNEVRWMCSWDTTEEDVDEFIEAIAEAVGG